jgi:hypothetical protein
MPEQHYKPGSRYAPNVFRLRDAAADNYLLAMRCTLCRRTVYYLASDLATIIDPSTPVYEVLFPCSRDGTAEFVSIRPRALMPGDYGNLDVRRPGPVRHVQTWRTVKLGDEIG